MFYVQASAPPPSSPLVARSHHLLLHLPFFYSFFPHTENAPKMKQTELANFLAKFVILPPQKSNHRYPLLTHLQPSSSTTRNPFP
jgi:hypothetical protein